MDQVITSQPRREPGGFSLVELLVVMAIIGLLMSFASMAVTSVLNGTNLERAGSTVADAIKLARQEAVSKNRETQLAFFELPADASGPQGLRGVEIWRIDDTINGQVTNRVTRLQRLPTQMMISTNSVLSTLLNSSYVITGTTNAGGVGNVNYKAIRFRANGMLAGASGSTNFITVQSARSTGIPPQDYFTILVNPLTGKVTTIRP